MLRGETPVLLVEAIAVAKAFGATRALRDGSFDLRAGRGPRARRRERLRQEHARQDPQRRARAGRRRDPPRRRSTSRVRTPRAAQAQRHRHGLPGGARHRGAVGARQRLAGHRRDLAHARVAAREARRARRGARRAARPPARPRHRRSRSSRCPTARPAASCARCCAQPRILILDEATSALDVATRDRLFAIINRLSSQGVGVIFITHRMDEITEIGDRITVMRSGDTVATLEPRQVDAGELVRLMTGSDRLARAGARGGRVARESRRGDVVLSARGLRLRPGRPADRRRGPRRRAGRRRRARGARPERVPRGAVGRGRVGGRGRPPRRRARGRDPAPRSTPRSTTSPTSRGSAAWTRCSRG